MEGALNCSIVGAAWFLGFVLFDIVLIEDLKKGVACFAVVELPLAHDEHIQAEAVLLGVNRDHTREMPFIVGR